MAVVFLSGFEHYATIGGSTNSTLTDVTPPSIPCFKCNEFDRQKNLFYPNFLCKMHLLIELGDKLERETINV